MVRSPISSVQAGRRSRAIGRLAVAGLLCLVVLTGAPGRAEQPDVIENGTLEIPLRGYPEPPPARSPDLEPPARTRRDAPPTPGRANGTDLSQTVARLGATIAPWSEIYRQRDPRSQLLARVPHTTYLAIKGQRDGYYAVLMIDGSLGWIPSTSVQLLEYDVVADTRPPDEGPATAGMSRLAQAVLNEAFKYLGVRYTWGGNGHRGIDCSGLVRNCFAALGLRLPRTASQQARVGTPVALNDLRAGDRLYFSVKRKSIDHTGIYLGRGYFIHASMSRGEVGVDSLSKPLYRDSLVSARRF